MCSYYFEKAKVAEQIRDDGLGGAGPGASRGPGVASDAKPTLLTKFGKADAPNAAAIKDYKLALEKQLSALMARAMAADRTFDGPSRLPLSGSV